jgi:Fur family ferric uptake transcriptional regulator
MSHYRLNYLQQIRDRGYRLTPQRALILDALCSLNGHATVNEVYEQVQAQAPAINRATVYRTLAFFCQLQMVSESQMNGATVYEIIQERPHHHLVCRQCGHVSLLEDHHLTELSQQLTQAHGFAADLNHLTISGVCAGCRE